MGRSGIFVFRSHGMGDLRQLGSWCSPHNSPKLDNNDLKQGFFRAGDECINQRLLFVNHVSSLFRVKCLHFRCSECGTAKEEYSDEEIGLCIVALGTFIHREPALAAPLLPDMLNIVAK